MAQDAISWLIIIALIALVVMPVIKALQSRKKIKKLTDSSIELTPEQFLKLKHQRAGKGKRQIASGMDCPGVYVLYNKTKRMYYVGQGKKVMERIAQHFSGHGNADVYADWKYGDQFSIRIINLQGSGFNSLNSLERNTIATYKNSTNLWDQTC